MHARNVFVSDEIMKEKGCLALDLMNAKLDEHKRIGTQFNNSWAQSIENRNSFTSYRSLACLIC